MVSDKTINSAGFTLIELLVVIAIIGVMATVVIASLNSARLKARNVQRNSDVKQQINAFNLGFSSLNSMPTTAASPPPALGSWACISTNCYAGYSANATVDAFLSPYIVKPVDPTGGSRTAWGYIYNSYVVLGGAFLPGAYLLWYVEPPLTTISCGIGTVRTIAATYIECAFKVD